MTREFVGCIDKDRPPVCRNLNGDTNIELIKSPPLATVREGFETLQRGVVEEADAAYAD